MPVLVDLCSSFRSLPPKDAIVASVVNVSAIVVSFAMVGLLKWLLVYIGLSFNGLREEEA